MMKFSPKAAFPTTVKSISKELTPYFGITSEALIQMKCYVDGCDDEIGWFFTVQRDEENKRVYYIKQCLLFEQQVHSTTTEIDGEKLAKFATDLLEQPNGFDIYNELRGWGHSHVNMGITPSGQDDNQMEFFARAGQPFFVRVIANKKGELKIDLYDYETGVAFIDAPWVEMASAQDVEIVKQIAILQARLDKSKEEQTKAHEEIINKEIKTKVSKFRTVYTYERAGYSQQSNFQQASIGSMTTGTLNNIEFNPIDEFDYSELFEIGSQSTRWRQVDMIEEIAGVKNFYTQTEINLILDEALRVCKMFAKKPAKQTKKERKTNNTSIVKENKIINI